MSDAAAAAPPGSRATTVIDPEPARLAPAFRELFQYRELLYFLAWRDVKVRYKQTALGVAWAVLQPVLTMVVFSVFLGRLAGVPSDGLPYPLFAYVALVPWQLFAHALTDSGNSVVANQTLITKVYFPRLVIPVATVLAGLVDFGVALAVLVALMVVYGTGLSVAVLALPLFILLALATALGAGLWLSALNVQYRDVRYALPFIAQLWLFASPVAYPSSLVPERWRLLYGLNPVAGVVEGFRWALVGGSLPPGWLTLASGVAAVALLVSGLAYFRRMEDGFADTV
ncbi:MAG: ABC transporter permease [Candidatus Rokubacteria bacterium]|nr:ABC transporter permease [Candidatus Rokubacteria bacterium]